MYTCNELTALTAISVLLNALIHPKEVEASSFPLWSYRIYTCDTAVLDFGPVGSVGGVIYEFQV